jgi:hypothetical protein
MDNERYVVWVILTFVLPVCFMLTILRLSPVVIELNVDHTERSEQMPARLFSCFRHESILMM